MIVNNNRKQLADALAGQLSRVDFFNSNEGKFLQSLASRGILSALHNSSELKKLQDAAKAAQKILDKGTVEETLTGLQRFVEKSLKLDQIKKVAVETDFDSLDDWLQLKLSDFLDEKLNLQRLDQIRKTVNLLLAKRQDFYEKALKALNRQYEFSFAYTYQSTTTKTALFDLEFDFSHKGQVSSLLKAALNGDFDKVLVKPVNGVKLNQAALTHQLDRQAAVEVSLPFFKKNVTRLNRALAKVNAVDEEDGRILVYDLTAKDRVTAIVENKMVRDSSLVVGVNWQQALGNAVRRHNPDAVSYSYTFRQARRAMRVAELGHQVKPYVEKYLPSSFST